MKTKEMEKLIKHCDTYFAQDDCIVLHPIADNGLHIDVLLYKPNDKYNFWKLVTMGASDYKMPAIQNTVELYNEYVRNQSLMPSFAYDNTPEIPFASR